MDQGSYQVSRIKADINVTPLVDVVLVLLIIFMLVTPLIGESVRLPEASHPAMKGEDPGRIVVALGPDGVVRVGGKRVLEDEFVPRIRQALRDNPQAQVVLKADSHLSYGDVKKTMLRIREAGFEQIGVMAKQKDIT